MVHYPIVQSVEDKVDGLTEGNRQQDIRIGKLSLSTKDKLLAFTYARFRLSVVRPQN